MNNTNLVSVLMSTYNSKNTIRRSIESIISQTYSNIEFLIIDDGSTDNTYSICKEYETNFDFKLTELFVMASNTGVCKISRS